METETEKKEAYSILGAALERCDGDREKAEPVAMAMAGWRLERIAERQVERARVKARLLQFQFWAEEETRRLNDGILRDTFIVDGFYADFPPADGKTIRLPEGKISRRVTKPKTEKEVWNCIKNTTLPLSHATSP